jgi:hypothetical protein
MLLLNGDPLTEPYTYDQLARFIPLSRLERIEVYYDGSPFLSGGISANAAINVVIEEGGREAPDVELDFTYGSSNRRARRAWFSTPEAHITAVIAYDEYLQDAFESYVPNPYTKLGKYDSRSVLTELKIAPKPDRSVAFRFHRYDDTYLGTGNSAFEDIRYDGYEARLGLRIDGFSLSLRQRVVDVSRLLWSTSAIDLEGGLRWIGSIRGVDGLIFMNASRSEFENIVSGAYFDPIVSGVEAGASAKGGFHFGLLWKAEITAGDHSEIGEYLGGEAGISIRGIFAPRLEVARRIRVPTVQELFQPESLLTYSGSSYLVSGNHLLEPGTTDELSAGASLGSILDLALYLRDEKKRISVTDGRFETLDGGEVMGMRGRVMRGGTLYGIDYAVSASAEYSDKASEYSYGVPEYRGLGGLLLRRRFFKQTETLSLRYDFEIVGDRSWGDVDLESYMLHDVSASLTILGARVVFQYKNILDESYETIPGFLMPGRHYTIGVWWELLD